MRYFVRCFGWHRDMKKYDSSDMGIGKKLLKKIVIRFLIYPLCPTIFAFPFYYFTKSVTPRNIGICQVSPVTHHFYCVILDYNLSVISYTHGNGNESIPTLWISAKDVKRIVHRLGSTLLSEHEKLFDRYWRQVFGPPNSSIHLLVKDLSVRTSQSP
jgi:hypothetical protein